MCNCYCASEVFDPWEEPVPYEVAVRDRNIFQAALDVIASIIDGKHLDDLTDLDLDAIRAEVLKR